MTSEEKKERTEKLREFHADYLAMTGNDKVKFFGHLAYAPKEYPELDKCISVFESQIADERGFYVELVDKDLIRKHSDSGNLYYYKYNPYYNEENPSIDRGKFTTYFIPVSSLELVKQGSGLAPETTVSESGSSITTSGAISTKTEKVSPSDTLVSKQQKIAFDDSEDDVPWNQMTAKDFAAIFWKKPISDKEVINKLIEKENNG
ncbi:MAG: hypothetical protein KDH96_11590 [Candidatus Riesia sp.]|nr:hypothetical protein [Candidatus Riesia sp.]